MKYIIYTISLAGIIFGLTELFIGYTAFLSFSGGATFVLSGMLLLMNYLVFKEESKTLEMLGENRKTLMNSELERKK